MTDERSRNGPTPPSPPRHACPQCLNPHTIVADQSYRGVLRFCPMCDYSWIVGDGGKTGT